MLNILVNKWPRSTERLRINSSGGSAVTKYIIDGLKQAATHQNLKVVAFNPQIICRLRFSKSRLQDHKSSMQIIFTTSWWCLASNDLFTSTITSLIHRWRHHGNLLVNWLCVNTDNNRTLLHVVHVVFWTLVGDSFRLKSSVEKAELFSNVCSNKQFCHQPLLNVNMFPLIRYPWTQSIKNAHIWK